MSDGTATDRLAQLLSRWESDPSSRVFLQVAEEYRHRGRTREALAVLDRGLKEHPGYLSALVAKGRCHLELGEADVARGVLERVVKQDATQMVANKLLVRACLETGDPEQARERLDLYSLLNDSDPEIEELRRRIRAMDQPPQAARTEKVESGLDLFDLAPPAAPAPVHRGGDIFELDVPAAPPAPPAAVALEEPFAGLLAPTPPPAVAAGEEAGAGDDPFPGLGSRDSLRRYLQGLSAEGLFAVDTVLEEPPSPAPVSEPEIFAPEPFPEPEPVALAEPALDETTPWAPEPELALPEPEPVQETVPAEPIATATLGELYLRQGHLEEAERIFREVLRHEADNAAAREGLARLAGTLQVPEPVEQAAPVPVATTHGPLDAAYLLAGFDPAAVPAGASLANARRAFVLNSYLQRLREGSQRDVS